MITTIVPFERHEEPPEVPSLPYFRCTPGPITEREKQIASYCVWLHFKRRMRK